MPPMASVSIGGISTGLSSYSGLVCVPPYSQNAGVDSTYVTVWRLLAYHVSQLLYSCLFIRCVEYVALGQRFCLIMLLKSSF